MLDLSLQTMRMRAFDLRYGLFLNHALEKTWTLLKEIL